MNKAVIILSGGMDSGVLLAEISKKSDIEIHAITFQYGSNHNVRELACAKQLCQEYIFFSCLWVVSREGEIQPME